MAAARCTVTARNRPHRITFQSLAKNKLASAAAADDDLMEDDNYRAVGLQPCAAACPRATSTFLSNTSPARKNSPVTPIARRWLPLVAQVTRP